MVIRIDEAISLQESIKHPSGYNKVQVQGFGDELKRARFPVMDWIAAPSSMLSDGETWYTFTVKIIDYTRPEDVEISTHIELGNAANYWTLSTQYLIQNLIDVRVGQGGPSILSQVSSVEGNVINFDPPLPEASIYTDFEIEYTGNRSTKFSTGYPSNLPDHLQPGDDVQLVGGEFNPDTGEDIVDGVVRGIDENKEGIAFVSIQFKPTTAAHGPCVITATYKGFSIYRSVPVNRGDVGNPSLSLVADPTTIYPRGTVNDDPDKTDRSKLTFRGTYEDGTPLYDGTDIVFELLRGRGSFSQGAVSQIFSRDEIEDVATSSSTVINASFPITDLYEVTMEQVAGYSWTFNPVTATVSGSQITLGEDNHLPLDALPVIIHLEYRSGGIATKTFFSSATSVPDEENDISAKIDGTPRNALCVVRIGDPGTTSDTPSYTLSFEADPTQLAEKTPGNPGEASDLTVWLYDGDGYVPEPAVVTLDEAWGGASGGITVRSVSVTETENRVEEPLTLNSSQDANGNTVFDTVSVSKPLYGLHNLGGTGRPTGVTVREYRGPGDYGQSFNLSTECGGNTLKLANPPAVPVPVSVSYTATGKGTSQYVVTEDNVEEEIGIWARAVKVDPALFQSQTITVGTPTDDDYELTIDFVGGDGSVEYSGQNPAWAQFQGTLIDKETDLPANGVTVDLVITEGDFGGFWEVVGPLFEPTSRTLNLGQSFSVTTDANGVFGSDRQFFIGTTSTSSPSVTASATVKGLVNDVPDQPVTTTSFTMSLTFLPPASPKIKTVTILDAIVRVNTLTQQAALHPTHSHKIYGPITVFAPPAYITDIGGPFKDFRGTIYTVADPAPLTFSYVYDGVHRRNIFNNANIDVGGGDDYEIELPDSNNSFGGSFGWKMNISLLYDVDPLPDSQIQGVTLEEPDAQAQEGDDADDLPQYQGVAQAKVYLLQEADEANGVAAKVVWQGYSNMHGEFELPLSYPNSEGEVPSGRVPIPIYPQADKVYKVLYDHPNFKYNLKKSFLTSDTFYSNYGITIDPLKKSDADDNNDTITISARLSAKYVSEVDRILDYHVKVTAKVKYGSSETIPTESA